MGLRKKEELFKMTNKWLREEGWDSVTAFVNGSKITFSNETVRRAFVDTGDRKISPEVLAVVLRYLNRPLSVIKEVLQTYTDDTEMWHLIGDQDSLLNQDEEALVKAYRAIIGAKQNLRVHVAQTVSLLAIAANVDVTAEIELLRRNK